MKEYKSHPLSEIFPLMPPADIKDLAADIRQRGLQNPIITYEGSILDGRHRYEACMISGVKPTFDTYIGDDPVGFVIAANLKRRHLTTSQKAMVAASLADLKIGSQAKNLLKTQQTTEGANLRPRENKGNSHISSVASIPTHENAAKMLDISARSVDTASKILDASPSLAKEVANGKISLHAADEKLKENKKQAVEQVDKTGWPIPQKIQGEWDSATELARTQMGMVSKMKSAFESAQEKKTPAFNEVIISAAVANCKSLYADWKNVMPYAVCPVCQGKAAQSCSMCKKRGYVSEFFWSRCVAQEQKDMREKILNSK